MQNTNKYIKQEYRMSVSVYKKALEAFEDLAMVCDKSFLHNNSFTIWFEFDEFIRAL